MRIWEEALYYHRMGDSLQCHIDMRTQIPAE